MITQSDAITMVQNANSFQDVFKDLENWKKFYKELALVLHPDKCPTSEGHEAFVKLERFKNEITHGIEIEDDAGKVTYKANEIIFEGRIDLLEKSLRHYRRMITMFNPKKDGKFNLYLPASMSLEKDKLIVGLKDRAIPLSKLGVIEQVHVNWIVSRILEITAWFNQTGYIHAGLNMDSVFVVPETHGIIITSFYHMTRLNSKLSTISGRYKYYYDVDVFSNKLAVPSIDVECIKHIGANLLGDLTGRGVLLRKTHNPDYIDFLISYSKKTPYQIFKEYRKLLKENFEKKFYPFEV